MWFQCPVPHFYYLTRRRADLARGGRETSIRKLELILALRPSWGLGRFQLHPPGCSGSLWSVRFPSSGATYQGSPPGQSRLGRLPFPHPQSRGP